MPETLDDTRETPTRGKVDAALREGTKLGRLITGLKPEQVLILISVGLVIGLCIGIGFVAVELRDTVIRHEVQQQEREQDNARQQMASQEKDKQANRDLVKQMVEATKDSTRALDDSTKTNKAVQQSISELTRAVREKKGPMIDPN